MKKRVIVLGSTGSIGESALDIIARHRDKFKLIGLSAAANTGLLKKQISKFKPKYVSVLNKTKACALGGFYRGASVLAGEQGLLELANLECDILVMGISGLGALKPLSVSLGRAKRILLANKEAVISAGKILTGAMNRSRSEILPVDSEAWAVFNLIKNCRPQEVENIYITASGGPFFKSSASLVGRATLKQVLKHPVWRMGKQISVNSATLMNKGFEVMEISNLFNIPIAKIKVLIHPQSLVHSFLEKKDRTMLASLFAADMRIPIAACLGFPKQPFYTKELDLVKSKAFEFFEPDHKKFPSLKLAYHAAAVAKSLPAVLVAANEEAVNLYLKGRFKFIRLYKIVEKVVLKHTPRQIKSLEDILALNRWAKDQVRSIA